jgi:hypothetical protein
MPGAAGQLSVAAAVRVPAQVPSPRGRPGWPSAPRRCDPGEVGPPSGVAGARMSGRRPGWSLPCPRPGPAVGRPSSRSSGRPTSGVRCPVSGVQASGVQASGVQVSGRTGLRCPRHCRRAVRVALDLEWLGVGPPAGRSGSRWPRGPRAGGRLPVSGLWGIDGGGWPCPAAQGSTVAQADAWPASRLRRRLAAGPTRADRGPGCRPGGGARDAAGAHRSPRRASGRSPAWCPTMGLDQAVVTTLGGR